MGKNIVQVGIIGCGRIAQTRHIPEYADNPHARLAGFYNRTTSLAQSMAERFGGAVFASVEEMLANPDIDAVSVLTPNSTHASIALAALAAGKHVLCEKPMAVTPAECEQLAAAEKQGQAKLMIAQNQRFDPAHILAKSMLERGDIGEILSLKTTFSHPGPSRDPDSWFVGSETGCLGVMGDLGVHKLDLIRFLTGQAFTGVSAFLDTLDKKNSGGEKIDLDDHAVCTLRLSGGAVCSMIVSWVNYGKPENTTVIYATRGTLELYRAQDEPLTLCLFGQPPGTVDVKRCENSGVIGAFIDCIRFGTPSPVSASSVLPAMRAVFAAYESNQNNHALIPL